MNLQKLNLKQVNHGTVVVQEMCVFVRARARKALHSSSYKWIKECEEYRCETS